MKFSTGSGLALAHVMYRVICCNAFLTYIMLVSIQFGLVRRVWVTLKEFWAFRSTDTPKL